ncbi:hypothetical protein TrST_g1533 [Triparma strigata]|uniref:Uncharacterized protein n=1 Tax=Triparma strigata TaxID=1606541 RepID=A0A9W7BVP1_9STRA|nr:hypothetical protein TrST_g1533 [Triparma strigata]
MAEAETAEVPPKPTNPKKGEDKDKKKLKKDKTSSKKAKSVKEGEKDKDEEASSSKAAKKEMKDKKKKKTDADASSSDAEDGPPNTCLSKIKANLQFKKKDSVKDAKEDDGEEPPPPTSGRHSSVVSQEIDEQLQRMEAEKNKGPSIGERLVYVLCCVYCRAPDVTPEETPEERERREKIEMLLEQRAIEMKRLEYVKRAAQVKTVMYCENAVYQPPPPSEEVDGEVLGEPEPDHPERAKKSVVVVPVEEQVDKEDGDDDDDDGDDHGDGGDEEEEVKEEKPKSIDPQRYLYEYAHKHSFTTAFGPSPVGILISDYHTPASAAAEYYSALISYTSSLLAQRSAMKKSVLSIQCAERTRLAKIRFAARAVERAEEIRLEELEFAKERETWTSGYDLYLGMVTKVAKRVAHVTTNYWKIPAASTIIQKHFRRYRVAVRFPNFRKRVLAQRKRRLERSRYLAALEMAYGNRLSASRAQQQHIERIKYSRASRDQEGFTDDRGGWKPDYDATTDVDIWTHIWKPPEGSQFGVRNLKVKIPPESKAEATIIKDDKNAWVGVPVMVTEVRSKGEQLGPPKRDFFDTMKKFQHVKSTISKPKKKTEATERKGQDKYYNIKYNWIPAHMVESEIVNKMVIDLPDHA